MYTGLVFNIHILFPHALWHKPNTPNGAMALLDNGYRVIEPASKYPLEGHGAIGSKVAPSFVIRSTRIYPAVRRAGGSLLEVSVTVGAGGLQV